MKHATITLTGNGNSLALHYCSQPRKTKSGGVEVDIADRIAVGMSAKELASTAEDMSLRLVSPPSSNSQFLLRGKRQADGSIRDPIVDWEGNVIRVEVRK